MSVPTFLPNATSSFASHSADFAPHHPPHHQSFSSFAEQDHPQPLASTSRPSPPPFPPPPSTTRSPHSSSSSVSSAASSSSPTSPASPGMFDEPSSSARGRQRRFTGSSSAGSGAGAPRSADGSVGSLATTVSTGSPPPPGQGKEAVAEDDEMKDEVGENGPLRMREMRRRRSGSGAMDISTLSVREEDEEPPASAAAGEQDGEAGAGGEGLHPNSDGAGGRKARTASVLSSSSGSTTQMPPPAADDGTTASGRVGRRKAPRVGSFHGADERSQPSSASTSPSTSRPGPPSRQHSSPADQIPATPSSISVEPNTAPTAHHVDIVSYPPSELLRLLACLLEQIAQANDARTARAAAGPATAPASAAPSAGPSTRRNSLVTEPESQQQRQEDADWARGRFDAAPLNTPQANRGRRRSPVGGPGGPGILDNALEYDEAELAEVDDAMPTTPGVDLLRETGPGGGVEGFMPSLGGTHAPQPLSRRRGSSFIRNKRNEDGSMPSFSRRSSAAHHASAQAQAQQASSSQAQAASASSSAGSSATRPPPAPLGASPTPSSSEPPLSSLFTASAIALSSPNATLCFHARNVPAISIEAYLQRILKYCPTTNEVFLALLVYFDRMARIGLEAQRLGLPKDQPAPAPATAGDPQDGAPNPSKLFAIDSFNVHRLVIAGVTVASKFFSDVFYTNSRYAKVGGLPLHELNQLELQFLLLNDFRLKIPTDELQRYADQLILYWVGRNGTSNPAAAAASASREASRARTPEAEPPAPPRMPREDAKSAAAVETPPLTRSAVAAASAQAQAAVGSAPSPCSASSGSAQSASTHSPYPAHLAHSSASTGAGDPHGTPLSRAAGSSAAPRGGPSPSPSRAAGHTASHSHSHASESPHRPRSIRSHPSTSSSFSSSTVTPGTPSTTRGDWDGEAAGSEDEEDDGDERSGRGRSSRSASWGVSGAEAMQED
ncbi:cyclin-like protein interacting with PHO85 [Rhodotorula kratochvilovae]